MSPPPDRPRALLIDAMGTLVRLVPPAPQLRRLLAERFGMRISEAEAAGALRAEIAYYRAHLDEGRDRESLDVLRGRCAEALRAALPQHPRLGAVGPQEMTELLLDSLHFEAYPDAAPALAGARARGERVIAVSNWDVSLPEVLAGVGLASLLDAVVTSAAVGAGKPAPAIFAAALRLAAVGPEQARHVGDSLEEDVAGARAAGIEPVLVRRDGGPGPPGVVTIAGLDELAGAAGERASGRRDRRA